jgi:hypothetical protein
MLETHGLKLNGEYLQVCASAVVSGLRDVFEGSTYSGGKWDALLSNVPGAKSSNPRFAGKTMRAVAIPLAWLFDEPVAPVQAELL